MNFQGLEKIMYLIRIKNRVPYDLTSMWNFKTSRQAKNKQKQKAKLREQRTDWWLSEAGDLGVGRREWFKGVKKYKLPVIK